MTKNLVDNAKSFDRYTNDSQVANKLKKLFNVKQINNKYARGWAFPPLDECRELWEARNGGQWPWHRDVEEWQK